jgi:uncharacterized membrane protein
MDILSGGAGTTAAGLRYGLPTFVCPFFADQFMWGAMVHRAGVGPEPCPVGNLTVDILAKKLSELKNDESRKRAVALSNSMTRENGVQGGLQHFLDSLPRDSMLCDVSLLLGETKLAQYRIVNSDVKLSLEVAASMREQFLPKPTLNSNMSSRILKFIKSLFGILNPAQPTRQVRHGICNYALGRVRTVSQGFLVGWLGFFSEVFRAIFELFLRSDEYARTHGALGCLAGLIIAPFYMLYDLFRGLVILSDRIMVGIANGYYKKEKLYIIDTLLRANVHDTTSDINELRDYEVSSESRLDQLEFAARFANNASRIFYACKPAFPPNHWHWVDVDRHDLIGSVTRHGKSWLSLKDDEYEKLLTHLRECSLERLSFSRFCVTLGISIASRVSRMNRASIFCNPEFNKATIKLGEGTPIGIFDDDDDDDENTNRIPNIRLRIVSMMAQMQPKAINNNDQ